MSGHWRRELKHERKVAHTLMKWRPSLPADVEVIVIGVVYLNTKTMEELALGKTCIGGTCLGALGEGRSLGTRGQNITPQRWTHLEKVRVEVRRMVRRMVKEDTAKDGEKV